jgi:HAMP domain-containing protein
MSVLAGLPDGVQLSSPLKRLAGAVLEPVLAAVTLGVGWLAWSLVVWGRGQTPAKQLLGMVVARSGTRYAAGRGTMFFREIVAKTVVGLLPAAIAVLLPAAGGISIVALLLFPALAAVLNAWLLWDRNRQEPWDKLAVTVVVDDPFRQLVLGAKHVATGEPAAPPPVPLAAPEIALSAVAFNRAVHYLNARKFEVGLRLIEQGVGDARRHGDRRALERAQRIVAQIRPRLPPNLLWFADEIVRSTKKPLANEVGVPTRGRPPGSPG